ncbi:MAG: HEPN domain-containing protein [Oscillospiraceae bacterium]|nr:HEPN domain-containing protein [Oscillospiraceae bacterium]
MRLSFKNKRLVMSLFCGHLAIEKMLKAICAARHIPIIREHRLQVLANQAGLNLSSLQTGELINITSFNIAARYDDYKLRFHKQCTLQYAATWVSKIGEWYKYLKQIVLQERANLPNNSPML